MDTALNPSFPLAEEARRRDAASLFAVTHRADISEEGGVLLVNPGSLRRPAGEGGGYCYLTVEGEKVYPVLVGESVY
ncbi:MAG: metallophosphoesterase family protein [Christensenellaceae bacterium]